jgi:hypothetical protein
MREREEEGGAEERESERGVGRACRNKDEARE